MNGIKNLRPGSIVKDRYIIKKLIAKGGMASTYLAEDKKTNKQVVLKVLSLGQVENWKTFDLFKREISVLKNINHPQIPDYIEHLDIKIDGNPCYILVQEYVEGDNLYELVKKGKTFTLPEITEFLKSLLAILSYIHTMQPPVIHRDINPRNIIINKKGIAYLVDFSASGYLRKTTIAGAKSDTFVGTIGYMPPEQLYGKVLPQSDLYSLGVTAIFILTGKDPSGFELNDLRLDYHQHVNIPGYLERFLDMMTDPNSSKRPGSAGHALALLEKQDVEVYETLKEKMQQKSKGRIPEVSDPLIQRLYNAIEKNSKRRVKTLITAGVRLNPVNSTSTPPLKLALELNHLGIAEILMKYGADVNSEFKHHSLLFDSVLDGNIKQVSLLLKYGADVNAMDHKKNKTALQYAYENGYNRIYDLLIKHGAKGTSYHKTADLAIKLPPPPRRVPFGTRSIIKKQDMEIMGVIFAVKGLIFAFAFILSARVIPSFFLAYADGTAYGQIITIEETNSTENDVPVYKYYFRFKAGDGKEYTQYSFTTGLIYDDSEMVTIRYLNSNPKRAVIEGARYSTFDASVLFVLILPVIGFGILSYNKPKALKFISLLKWGKITGGKIIYKKRRRGNYLFFYEYIDDHNRRRTGRYKTSDSSFTDIGKSVPVIYLDNRLLAWSEVVDEPISYKHGIWYLGNRDSEKTSAIVFAAIRLILWLALFFMFVLIIQDLV